MGTPFSACWRCREVISESWLQTARRWAQKSWVGHHKSHAICPEISTSLRRGTWCMQYAWQASRVRLVAAASRNSRRFSDWLPNTYSTIFSGPLPGRENTYVSFNLQGSVTHYLLRTEKSFWNDIFRIEICWFSLTSDAHKDAADCSNGFNRLLNGGSSSNSCPVSFSPHLPKRWGARYLSAKLRTAKTHECLRRS